MSRRTPPPSSSRRARREAARSARQQARDRELARAQSAWSLPGSPVIWISGAAIVVAAILIGALVLLNRPTGASDPIVAPSVTSPPALANDRTLGDPNAPVTIDVWSDFQCPNCETYTTQVEPKIVDAYVSTGKAKIVYHDLIVIGPESIDAATAARCAGEQGQFWAYHDYLFANQGAENSGAFSRDRLVAIADELKLDQAAFTKCLDDGTARSQVEAEDAAGKAKGIDSTPTITVNGTAVAAWDYPTLAAAVDAALGVASPSPSGSSPSPSGASPSPSASPSL
ncbi:MAG: DsbA family protein [Candidatus Limnocylindrales bacterium]